MIKCRFAIIGAGPTGLGAAVRLNELGMHDFVILEAADRAGGLASTHRDAHGFTWDLGGHVQFSHYDTFDRHMDTALGPRGWLDHLRESWVLFNGRFVRYPFQNNLHMLDPEDRWRCAAGLLDAWLRARAGGAPPIKTFKDWILATFGEGISEAFMSPYNFKVWAHPTDELGYYWIGERVAVPDFPSILKTLCVGQPEDAWGPNHRFRFPRTGGTGAIWEAIAGWLHPGQLKLNTKVHRVDPLGKRIFCSDGTEVSYDVAISTAPLDILVRLVGDEQMLELAARLKHSSTHVIGVGLRGTPPASIASKSWMYFPDPGAPYYRVTVFSNYSPDNTPSSGHWSLMAEVAESGRKSVNPDTIVALTIDHLHRDRLVPDVCSVVSTWHRRLEHGYPTPTLDRDEVVMPLLRRFEGLQIYSRGRFGAWKYEIGNQDHCYAQGYELVDRLLSARERNWNEPTLNRPSLVNARRNT